MLPPGDHECTLPSSPFGGSFTFTDQVTAGDTYEERPSGGSDDGQIRLGNGAPEYVRELACWST